MWCLCYEDRRYLAPKSSLTDILNKAFLWRRTESLSKEHLMARLKFLTVKIPDSSNGEGPLIRPFV